MLLSILRVLWLSSLVNPAICMWHRKSQDYDKGRCNNEFENNLSDLFMTNQVSANRIQSLARDAAGLKHRQIRKSLFTGNKKNAHRDLRRRFGKHAAWPPVYVTEIRTWDTKKQQQVMSKVSLLLPHEVLHELAVRNDLATLIDQGNIGQDSLEHLSSMKALFAKPNAIGVAFWLDGCPCNWDRTESLEVLTMSVPGLHHENKNVRIPLAAVPKQFVLDHDSWDDIMQVMSWSLSYLCIGEFPKMRHDGLPFKKQMGSAYRLAKAGKSLEVDSVVCCFLNSFYFFSYACVCFAFR